MHWTRMTMTLALVLVLLTAGHQVSAKHSKCEVKRDLEMDICASKMGFLGDHSFVIPKNLTAMSEYCTQLKNSIGCIQSYAHDCLAGFTRQLLTSLLKRGKQQYKQICQTDQSQQDFISTMSCLSDEKIPRFHKCMDCSIARFEFIQSKVRPDFRLPSVCCSYQIFNREVEKTLFDLCGPNANATVDFVQRLVSGTTGEFFSLICDQHRSMADCHRSAKTSNIMANLEETNALVLSGALRPKSKSLVPVLLQILDTSAAN